MNSQISLRPWQLSDLPNLVKHANNMNIANFMMNSFPYPYTEEAGKKFIDFANTDNPVHIFAIVLNEEAIGGIGVHPLKDIQAKNAELGYWLAEDYWGKGIMTIAISQILEFTFKTYDFKRVFARPFGTNKASQRILEKNGFQLEAHFKDTFFKNGSYHDELIYAIRKT